MGDGVPEGGAAAGEGVGSRSLGEVKAAIGGCVGGLGGAGDVVGVVVGLEGGAGDFDEGVGVVEETGAYGGVIDLEAGDISIISRTKDFVPNWRPLSGK